MVELTDLDLSFNVFKDFPYEEGTFPRLINLDIRGNPILGLPKFILKTNLDKIYLEWDHILNEIRYLKDSGEYPLMPNLDSYDRNLFAMPITDIHLAFDQ